MNISPITSPYNNLYKNSLNYKGLKSNYNDFRNDLKNCYETNESMTSEIVSALVKKHIPNIEVKPKSEASFDTDDYACLMFGYELRKNDDGSFSYKCSKDEAIFIPDADLFTTQNGKLKQASILAHEMTHGFQKEKGEYEKIALPCGEYELGDIQDNFEAGVLAYENVEGRMFNFLIKSKVDNGILACDIPLNKSNLNYLSLQLNNMSYAMFISKIIEEELGEISAEYDNLDKNFILDYIILFATLEKEAYQNELNFQKDYLPIFSKRTSYDAYQESYDEIIRASRFLKNKYKQDANFNETI